MEVPREEKSKERRQWTVWEEKNEGGKKETCDVCGCAPLSQPTLSCSVFPPRVDVALLAQRATVEATGSHTDHRPPQQRDFQHWVRHQDAQIPPRQLTE